MIPSFHAVGKESIETSIASLITAGHMYQGQGKVIMSIVDRYASTGKRIVFQEVNVSLKGVARTEAFLMVDDARMITIPLIDVTSPFDLPAIQVREKVDKERIEDLESLCAELYQVLGVYNAPAKVLDKVSAAMNGEPIPDIELLPFYLED